MGFHGLVCIAHRYIPRLRFEIELNPMPNMSSRSVKVELHPSYALLTAQPNLDGFPEI